MTKDKAAMIYEAKSTLERWAADLICDPDTMFAGMAKPLKGKDVFTVEQLMCFIPVALERQNPTPSATSKALVKEGALRKGAVNVDGQTKRLMAIRNLDFWRRNLDKPPIWAGNHRGQVEAAAFTRKRQK